MCQRSDEIERLRREFDRLPKTEHAKDVLERHPEVRPEWVMQVIEAPYEEWTENDARGRRSRVIAGRVAGASQWIKVIINPQGLLITAHFDHHLEDRFGGRPWPENQ